VRGAVLAFSLARDILMLVSLSSVLFANLSVSGQSTGYDCSVRRCPKGDDPYTTGQVFEIQALKCTGTGGTITLSFRNQVTTTIAYNAAASAVESALELLTQVKTLYGDGVTVSYSTGSSLCTNDGSNVASITFTQVLGVSTCTCTLHMWYMYFLLPPR
jgi:hypothetical protein